MRAGRMATPRGGGAGWGIPPEGVWSPEWGVAKIEKGHPENLKHQKTVLPNTPNHKSAKQVGIQIGEGSGL